MRTRTRLAAVAGTLAVLGSGALLFTASDSASDTENCTSRFEYDNTQVFSSPDEIAARYDVPGYFIGSTDNYFRRGYKTCWAPDTRKIVVMFDLNSGLSDHWDVRDI